MKGQIYMTESWYSERCKAFDENYKRICNELSEAAVKAGRNPDSVQLLAATKTVPVEMVNYAIAKGLSCLGENRVQEFLDKYEALDKQRCKCQFIGHLQTNKVKYLIGKVSCIQSVDSVKLAREISRLSQSAGYKTGVLVQVNIGKELQKGGVMPESLLEMVDEIREFSGITVEGLMAVPPICDTNHKVQQYFSAMEQYYVDIKGKKLDNVSMNCLSMGMSSDYKEAIAAGSTMVRLGSALFGTRAYV